MGFVQIIEITTSKYDEMEALHDQWLRDTEGRRKVVAETICRDRERPDTYVVIVEFDSYEDAMINSDLPETAKVAAGYAALADEPQSFRNLDVIRRD